VIRVPFISCLAFLAIVACSGNDPVDDKAGRTAGLPDINATAPSAAGEPHKDTVPAKPLPAAATAIPAALQGRWGLTPADCTSSLGDAKGLLVINGNELRFYESRAVPIDGTAADDNSISGDFAFTGEGMSWTKFQSLRLQGPELVRTENNPAASFTYAKCN